MIKTKKDYYDYCAADLNSLGLGHIHGFKLFLLKRIKPIVRYQMALRRAEYLNNCKKNRFRKMWSIVKLKRMGIRYGFSIPINVFGKGLSIAHIGTIVINSNTVIGDNCRIHTCVNIGTSAGRSGDAPVIGNNVYIGPGAKIFGKIILADNIAIGANAVVNKSFEKAGVSIAGVPARVINNKGSFGLLGINEDKR